MANNAYVGVPAETQSESADYGTLSCAVRSDDHVQIWPGSKGAGLVGDEALHGHFNDGPMLVPRKER